MRFLLFLPLVMAVLNTFAQINQATMKPTNAAEPPLAKKIPKKITTHGYERTDNYFWLRDKKNPEVIAYLEAENAYTDAVMKHTEALQEKLYQEMKSRIKEEDVTVPVKEGNYYYYSRTEQDKQYRIHCRKKGSLDAPEEIILDENQLAQGHGYFRLGNFEISPNGQLLAYSTDTDGSENYTIYVKDLSTGQLLPDQISNTYYTLAWANDNKTFFYVILDEALRPYQLLRHTLGKQDNELVYHEKDEMYFLEVSKSKTEDFIFIHLESKLTTEVRYVDANQPDQAFQVFIPRKKGVEYHVNHHKNRFYIRTNENAKNFKLMEAPLKGFKDKSTWKEVIAHKPEVKLESVEVFDRFLVVGERSNGLRKLRISDLTKGQVEYVSFPEPVYMIYENYTPDYYATTLRFAYTSLIRPMSVFAYDMVTNKRTLLKEQEVPGGYDASRYATERIFARAADGTQVPMSVVYKKGIQLNGNNPLYLYGYGSYGITMDATFSSNRLSLVDRGFVFVIAHIRGGGDMGEEWYENGKFLKKKNTFTDFINCAEHLINNKYTSSEKLSISGGSAGGLLMGAVTNMRPDLFKVVVAKVPFVDVINTMTDPTLPLTVTEYEEWGDPNDKKYFDYMKSYSPYDNVEAKQYPNILVTAGLNDPRVSYWEPAKWVAKLRVTKKDNNLLLLKTNMGAGHGGASGRFDYLKDIAFEYAFILHVLGMVSE